MALARSGNIEGIFKRNLNNFIDSLDKAISDISAVKLILEEDSEEKTNNLNVILCHKL